MSRSRLSMLVAAVAFMCPIYGQAQTLPPDIAESKLVRIAVNAGYPPLEMRDPKTNELIGFDIDLANAMAEVLGVKLEWQDGAFEAMLPSLQSGRSDMIISGLYDLPKRRDNFDFIDYLKAGAQYYSLASNEEVKTPADLCGRTVTTTRGTSYPDQIKQWSDKNCAGKDPVTVIVDTDLAQQLGNLKQGRAEAAVQGTEAVPTIIQLEPGTYRILGEPFSSTLMGMAFNKKTPELRDAFQVALKKVIESGKYDELIKKWKLDLSAYKDATINAGMAP